MTALPITIRTTRYQCPFCARSRAKKAATEAHIARCWHNPETRSCLTCTHYEPPEAGPYPEHPGWPESCGAMEGPHELTAIRSNCPLWQARTEAP